MIMSQHKEYSVYLLHFTPAFKHAQHYAGYTPNGVVERLGKHLKGNGAKLVKAAVTSGCSVGIARVWKFEHWQEARAYERTLKRTHNLPKYCPICKANKRHKITKVRRDTCQHEGGENGKRLDHQQ